MSIRGPISFLVLVCRVIYSETVASFWDAISLSLCPFDDYIPPSTCFIIERVFWTLLFFSLLILFGSQYPKSKFSQVYEGHYIMRLDFFSDLFPSTLTSGTSHRSGI